MTDFKAKMHQIRFRLGLRPRPAGGAYSAPPDPLAGFGGLLLRRGKGREGRGGEGKGEEGRGGEGKGGKRRGRKVYAYGAPPTSKSWLRHWCQPRVSQTTLALHVSDSNDKKIGNSTWVTTSESTKKNMCLYRQVQTRLNLSINNTQLTIAGTRTPRRVTNKTAGPRRHAYVTTRSETTLPHYTWQRASVSAVFVVLFVWLHPFLYLLVSWA